MVCFIGGLAGVVVCIGGGLSTSAIAGWRVIFTVAPIVIAFSCAFLTGIIFGYLPARKAARLDPIEALARDWKPFNGFLGFDGNTSVACNTISTQVHSHRRVSSFRKCLHTLPKRKARRFSSRRAWNLLGVLYSIAHGSFILPTTVVPHSIRTIAKSIDGGAHLIPRRNVT